MRKGKTWATFADAERRRATGQSDTIWRMRGIWAVSIDRPVARHRSFFRDITVPCAHPSSRLCVPHTFRRILCFICMYRRGFGRPTQFVSTVIILSFLSFRIRFTSHPPEITHSDCYNIKNKGLSWTVFGIMDVQFLCIFEQNVTEKYGGIRF